MVSGGGGQKSLWINCSTYVINKKSSSHYYLGIPTSIFSYAFPVLTHKSGIWFPQLFWPTVRKIVPVMEIIFFEIRSLRPRICKFFENTRTIYSNNERSEHFMKQNVFWLVPGGFPRYDTVLIQIGKNNWNSETYRKT